MLDKTNKTLNYHQLMGSNHIKIKNEQTFALFSLFFPISFCHGHGSRVNASVRQHHTLIGELWKFLSHENNKKRINCGVQFQWESETKENNGKNCLLFSCINGRTTNALRVIENEAKWRKFTKVYTFVQTVLKIKTEKAIRVNLKILEDIVNTVQTQQLNIIKMLKKRDWYFQFQLRIYRLVKTFHILG